MFHPNFQRDQVFGPDCRDPQYVLITESLKEKILATHNELRNTQAMGVNEDLLNHQVADMATMVKNRAMQT